MTDYIVLMCEVKSTRGKDRRTKHSSKHLEEYAGHGLLFSKFRAAERNTMVFKNIKPYVTEALCGRASLRHSHSLSERLKLIVHVMHFKFACA